MSGALPRRLSRATPMRPGTSSALSASAAAAAASCPAAQPAHPVQHPPQQPAVQPAQPAAQSPQQPAAQPQQPAAQPPQSQPPSPASSAGLPVPLATRQGSIVPAKRSRNVAVFRTRVGQQVISTPDVEKIVTTLHGNHKSLLLRNMDLDRQVSSQTALLAERNRQVAFMSS